MRAHHHGLKRERCRVEAVLVLEFLTIVLIVGACIPPVEADMIVMGYMNEGAAVHNGTHICMPEAYVRIDITRTGSGMRTSMNAEFLLSTNTTQNATIGFVTPRIFTHGGEHSFNLTIAVNGSEMEFKMLGWADLGVDHGFTTELIDALGAWLEDAEYAVFSAELQADSTAIISATSSTSQEIGGHGVDYHYTIASARTFEGDTHEVVHMQLIEETPFLSVEFFPDSYLTLTEDGIQTVAVWDFNVSQFEDDSVGMSAMVSEYYPGGQPYNLDWIFPSIAFIAITAIVVILGRRRRTIPQSTSDASVRPDREPASFAQESC